MPHATPDHAYGILAGITIFLVLLPMPWHFQAWNSGTVYYMTWTVIGLLINMVGQIVWDNSLMNPAPVWCDISTKLQIGLSVGLPCASLCINRRLYVIANMSSVTITRQEKRRAVLIDTFIAVGVPMLIMALHYVVQGHRFNIIENFGCQPATYATPLAFVLVLIWPSIIAIVSLVYCALSIRAFLRRRAEFRELMKTNTVGLSLSKYMRLMLLASTEMVFGLPLSLYFIITDLTQAPIFKWKSWSDTHSNFSRIIYLPFFFFDTGGQAYQTWVSLQISRYAVVFVGIIFFLFFGLADDTRRNYRTLFYTVVKPLGIVPPSHGTSYATKPSTSKWAWFSRGSTTATSSKPVMISLPKYASKSNTSMGPISSVGDFTSPELDVALDSLDDTKVDGRPISTISYRPEDDEKVQPDDEPHRQRPESNEVFVDRPALTSVKVESPRPGFFTRNLTPAARDADVSGGITKTVEQHIV